MMRKILSFTIFFALAAVLALQFASCEKYVLPELSLTPDTLKFSAAADSLPVQVKSNVIWNSSAANQVDWLKWNRDGMEGDQEMWFYATENTNALSRRETITFKSESLKRSLVVIQEGKSQPVQD